jgi:hypothetical protein
MVNWKQRVVTGIGLLAAVAAILTVGYSLGKDHNDALVNFLREKNQMLEAREKTLRAEVEALKLELQQRHPPQSSSTGTLVDAQALTGGNPDQRTSSPEKAEEAGSQVVSIFPGTTAQPFGGAILITFQGLRFEGNPPRYRLDATLGKVGKPSKDLQGIVPGQVINYEGFEVRLMDTNPLSAKFLVTRL